MAESTWTTRDLQVMGAVRAIEQRRRSGATVDEVADEAGRGRDEVLDALRDLVDGGYVDGADAGDKMEDDWLSLRLTAAGRRAVG